MFGFLKTEVKKVEADVKAFETAGLSQIALWRASLGNSPKAQLIATQAVNSLEVALMTHPLAIQILEYVKAEVLAGAPPAAATAAPMTAAVAAVVPSTK